MLAFLTAHKAEILGALLAISEGLALVPQIKSNSVFTLVVNLLIKLKGSPNALPPA